MFDYELHSHFMEPPRCHPRVALQPDGGRPRQRTGKGSMSVIICAPCKELFFDAVRVQPVDGGHLRGRASKQRPDLYVGP